MRNDRERIYDIQEAVERIERRSNISKSEFERDELVQTWMVHYLQIIGEAASHLSDEFRERHPQVPWRTICAMRNVLVHAYFRVDLDEVWSAVQNDVPVLKRQIDTILQTDN